MQHERDYCDECGCKPDSLQLTIGGRWLCIGCVLDAAVPAVRVARRREARDDGK